MKRRSGGVPRERRLNSEFKKEIYEIVSRKLNDPEISAMFSITEVETSKDLSHAKVFVSVYSTDEEKKNSTFNAIKRNAKKIRFELGSVMRIRTVPELTFLLDGSMEYGDKMDKLFSEINKNGKNTDEN